MPAIGRLLAVLASYLVGYAADKGLTLDPEQVTAIMLGIYATVHTLYRSKRAEGDKRSRVSASDLPKGTL